MDVAKIGDGSKWTWRKFVINFGLNWCRSRIISSSCREIDLRKKRDNTWVSWWHEQFNSNVHISMHMNKEGYGKLVNQAWNINANDTRLCSLKYLSEWSLKYLNNQCQFKKKVSKESRKWKRKYRSISHFEMNLVNMLAWIYNII